MQIVILFQQTENECGFTWMILKQENTYLKLKHGYGLRGHCIIHANFIRQYGSTYCHHWEI